MEATPLTLGLVLLLQVAFCADTIWMTDYDQPFTFECDDNHHLKSIDSEHSSSKEDRVFNFTCEAAPAVTILSACEWSGMDERMKLIKSSYSLFTSIQFKFIQSLQS
ncbi:hemagglutinin/amebocyte aggregation factor [Elysia marginata]|uniref:Hemagglutinin/amebocyte aggregation factor n=1 Tax=Elysia marginata TaxID=1093978 RepID=A0AAV4JWQ8_9GAST|nr:hemagglutinin/amebocyte aggregation factor [Elysia marginata]